MTETAHANTALLPRLALALGAIAASSALAACGGDTCPYPVFGEPVTVAWLPTTGTVTEVTPVVLRWSATNDPLPERYYEPYSVESPPGAASIPATSARRTGLRELTLEMRELDAYVRNRPRFTVRMRFPDTQGYAQCSHPGMSDQYIVDVTFDFNAAARTVTARFSEIRVAAGDCSVAAPGAGASGGGAVAIVALAGALRGRRRHGRGR